jgi:membrane protein implicated in regulation of membrane protease activity
MAERSKWWVGKPGLVAFTALAATFWFGAALFPDQWFRWVSAAVYTVLVAILWVAFLRDRRRRQRETP